MNVNGPSIPFHLAKAYGVSPTRVRPASTPGTVARIGNSPQNDPQSNQLTAATVPGKINFDAAAKPSPAAPGGTLPFYTRPGDRNEAATVIQAGRSLDITG